MRSVLGGNFRNIAAAGRNWPITFHATITAEKPFENEVGSRTLLWGKNLSFEQMAENQHTLTAEI